MFIIKKRKRLLESEEFQQQEIDIEGIEAKVQKKKIGRELNLMYGHLWNAIMVVEEKFYYETK